MIGYCTESTGDVRIEIPEGMNLDIEITSGSGDVTVDTSVSDNILIDATVGEKTITSKGENLAIKSIPSKDGQRQADILDTLDERFLEVPNFAVEQSREIVIEMSKITRKSILDSITLLDKYDEDLTPL